LALALAPANSQGLTLIECLVAIIMVALVASAITPALILSVATRVQSQKAEQALALGQAEIDRVRQMVEQGQTDNVAAQIPLAPATVLDNTDPDPDKKGVQTQVGAAVGAANVVAEDEFPATPTETRAVDVNNDNRPDFAVQIYRTRGLNDVDGFPVAFALGVRVYDYDAVASGTGGNLSTDPLSLGITGGTGKRSERPMVALYTTVAVAERGDSLCDMIRYSQSTSGIVASSPLGCGP
jgi:prepilin-type N-terminal cleavage/methylation domain-containing protein